MTITTQDRLDRLAQAVADTQTKLEVRRLPDGSEQRFCSASIRSETASGKRYAVGYSATFNTLSHDLGGFKERIQPGAFRQAIAEKQDTVFLYNHDPNFLIARVSNGSLRLSEDSRGLAFRAELPINTSAGNDLAEMLDLGLITECSFSFIVGGAGQRWSKETDPETGESCDVRDLLEVGQLFDCAAVCRAAYPSTSIAASRALWAGGGEMPAEIRSRINAGHGHIDEHQKNLVRRARLALASIL